MTFYEYHASLERAVDGDTLDMNVDLGFYVSVDVRVRLLDVDTHEIYRTPHDSEEYQLGMDEKEFVEEWFESVDGNVTIRTEKDAQGKYGRWLARVYGNGECLNERLVEEFDVGTE